MNQAHSLAMRIGLLAVGGVALAIAGCPGGSPCAGATCPKVEGRYAMSYGDAGLSGADCATLSAPAGPGSIEITRSGAELHATLLGAPGRGVIQDSFDFSIAATDETDGGTQSYTLRGYYVPGNQKGDGGEPGSLVCKWLTRTERAAKACEAERACSGIKQ